MRCRAGWPNRGQTPQENYEKNAAEGGAENFGLQENTQRAGSVVLKKMGKTEESQKRLSQAWAASE